MTFVRDVEYEVEETPLRGRLAVPDGDGPFPAVLIAHEANGLDEYQASRAETLAGLGYAAFALDYHGGRQVFTNRDEMMVRLETLAADVDGIRALASAGLEVLTAEAKVDCSRVAAVGFCFGETVVMELARAGADLKAVVGFHPGLNILRPGDSRHIQGKVLMCIGADDPLAPPERVSAFAEELTSSGVDWQMNIYGGVGHSFTHPRAAEMGIPGRKYDKVAAERSWKAMLALLEEVFRT